MSDWYRRDGTGPLTYEEAAGIEWGARATVAKDTVGAGLDEAQVSTVFLSLDHQFGDGPPLIFETMIFGGRYDQMQERYSTEQDALAGHRRWVEKVAAPSPRDRLRLAALIDQADDANTDNPLALAEHLLAAGLTIPEAEETP